MLGYIWIEWISILTKVNIVMKYINALRFLALTVLITSIVSSNRQLSNIIKRD